MDGCGSSAGKYLVWQDLTVVAPAAGSGSKLLLNGITGYAQPDRIMALMGPSGSGKSTLLDALAGRLPANVRMCGDVILNGNKRSINSTDISYVTQEDIFMGSLTVRETLTYSAHLRLPSLMTKEEKIEVVEETLSKMGLQDCAETYIGNWHLRGISNGEKRRLSICIEILTQPHVLLLDEPTSGLDSASSFFVIWALRNIARDGRIVICSIHQPSSDVFNLFNDLLLIAGGETVYFGEPQKAVKFFSDAGFPCPTRKNPPEHYLRCISSDFDKVITALILSQRMNYGPSSLLSNTNMNLTTEEIKDKLINIYKKSPFSIDARTTIQEILLTEKLSAKSNKGNSISWLKQLWTLTCRTSLNMSRDIGYYWLRCLFYVLIAVSAGSFFYHIGTDNQAIVSRGKCDGFIYGLMICLSIGGIPFVIEELKVFRRERLGGHYGEALFVLSNFISSLPFVVLMAFSAGTILYHMVQFHNGFSHYFYFCLNLLCCIVVTEGTALIVASLVPNLLMGIGCAAAVTVIMMMPSLLFRRVFELPKFFWQYPMSYLSYAGWAIEGQLKNDMIGMEFDSPLQGEPKLKGEIILREMYGINPDSSKWWNLAALTCLLVGLRFIFYVVLKYKERSSLFFQTLYAKRTTLQSHVKVASFRKDQYISSSKRHRTLTPLSSQEGLGSPLP
ncbi:PREDICTED: ABC transporter G family member 15-like isoform X2 [Fragaria vesca subsp. vesca]|uniref:ABC transporter G family member 15-like isoform X2 n=1 Tax=Fragaria vesca subsp. vesca TaxID=101020 RepID=UPI0002C30489|nr:PREDICTED: ABC transporter G family member 15-like isoform X2 [Fragaria vesca subsp. vesca]